jgi:hypothetical protein
MPNPSSKIQNTETINDMIVISSTAKELEVEVKKTIRICWNTGEEKNCSACYLSKGCKAKA